MRRVLMISPHFPPDTSAGAHRVRLLAPHLCLFGWEPTVVTVEERGYEGRLDPDLAALVPDSVRVLRVPAWPAPLTRWLGIGDLGLRALCGLRRGSARLLAQEHFDALFITIYPTYPALLGPSLKRRFGLPFVLDYQDPWVGSWGRDVGPGGRPNVKSRMSRALAGRLEPRVVRAADALTAVSARTYEDVLARVTDAKPRACDAIPLGFEEADMDVLRRAPRANRHFDRDDGRVHLSYVGTILPAGIDVLRAALAGLARLKERSPAAFSRLRLHFFGTSNQRQPDQADRVLPIARELGVADAVTEEAVRLDYLDALNVQLQSHAVLLLGSTEPHYTPSKVFPALLAGRRVLAVYHQASSVVPLLSRVPSAALVTFDGDATTNATIDAIAQALECCTHPEQVAWRLDRAAFAGWSAAAQAGRLAGVLDAIA